ncbi:MAG: hypothetical protein SF051_16675, partial [Elusimicrobiota bacterium]|nr:hypothetical protein [Elusimicrobiota bacterium]
MRRLLIAALLLQTIPAPALAAVTRVGVPRIVTPAPPLSVGVVRLAPPSLGGSLSAPSVSLKASPLVPTAQVRPVFAPLPEVSVAAAPADAPRPARAAGPAAALPAALAAAEAAQAVVARPGDAATDRAAIDF